MQYTDYGDTSYYWMFCSLYSSFFDYSKEEFFFLLIHKCSYNWVSDKLGIYLVADMIKSIYQSITVHERFIYHLLSFKSKTVMVY